MRTSTCPVVQRGTEPAQEGVVVVLCTKAHQQSNALPLISLSVTAPTLFRSFANSKKGQRC